MREPVIGPEPVSREAHYFPGLRRDLEGPPVREVRRDLAAVGLEEGGIADQAGAERRRGRRPARLCPTSSCSETARRTGSARRDARPSARSGALRSPRGPRAVAPPARLTAAGPAARRRRRRDRAAPRRAAVAVNDPVDGLALRLEHVVEAGLDDDRADLRRRAGRRETPGSKPASPSGSPPGLRRRP